MVIVINPVSELGLCRFRIPSRPGSLLFGSEVSDIYLQPHVGADIACFKALLKGVVERDAVDRAYVAAHVDGWDRGGGGRSRHDWTTLLDACGLARVDVDRAAAGLATARRGVMLWAMGLTHHEHGVQNVVALANLALARGWVGREGCGLLPIRGHSNVQGVGSVGFAPALKEAFATSWKRPTTSPRLRHRAWTPIAAWKPPSPGQMRVCVLGGNLFGSTRTAPGRKRAARIPHDLVVHDEAQRRPRTRPRRHLDHPARARARRGVAGDHAGSDVQLRAPVRGRRGAAERVTEE